MCASSRNVIIPPTHHPRSSMCATPKVCVCVQLGMYPTQRYVCVCTVGNVCKSKVCYHPHPTHPPTHPDPNVCVCVQLGMYASPTYVNIPHPTHPPTTPTQRYVCVCSWECMQVQGMLPSPPHPPTPTQRYVCVQLGMCASPRYVTIPTPPTHPPQRYVCMCVYRWVPKNTLCVQMSQICVRRWGFWGVCTDESNLCAQMSPLPVEGPSHQWSVQSKWPISAVCFVNLGGFFWTLAAAKECMYRSGQKIIFHTIWGPAQVGSWGRYIYNLTR